MRYVPDTKFYNVLEDMYYAFLTFCLFSHIEKKSVKTS